jgi:hypothetical protein
VGGVADALAAIRSWIEDGLAEVGGAAIVRQGQTGNQPGQGRATQDASDASQGLAPRGRRRQGFGHLIKNTLFHLAWFLSW